MHRTSVRSLQQSNAESAHAEEEMEQRGLRNEAYNVIERQ